MLLGAEVANLLNQGITKLPWLNKHFVESIYSKFGEVNGCSQNFLCDVDNTDPTLNAIERFEYHPSIIAIKQKLEMRPLHSM